MQHIILNEDMAYLIGVIVGDGHISNSFKSKADKSKDYRIVIDICDRDYLCCIEDLIKSFIKTKSRIKPAIRKLNRRQRYYLQIRNKKLYAFLTDEMGIKKGAKSSSVQIPEKILNGSAESKKNFIAGLFDTDGGFRGNTLGFTTASKILRDQTVLLLRGLGITCFEDSWINRKYGKRYFGIRISKGKIVNFLNMFSFRNIEKILRIHSRFPQCGGAGVVKRDRKPFSKGLVCPSLGSLA